MQWPVPLMLLFLSLDRLWLSGSPVTMFLSLPVPGALHFTGDSQETERGDQHKEEVRRRLANTSCEGPAHPMENRDGRNRGRDIQEMVRRFGTIGEAATVGALDEQSVEADQTSQLGRAAGGFGRMHQWRHIAANQVYPMLCEVNWDAIRLRVETGVGSRDLWVKLEPQSAQEHTACTHGYRSPGQEESG